MNLPAYAEQLATSMMRAQAAAAPRPALKPGIYPGLPMADYLALPAFSASVAQEMLERCPAAAWFGSWLNPSTPEPDDSDASDAGSIAHAILLEGSEANVAVVDPRDHPAERTGGIPDGWTNKSIRAARDAARAAGKIPILVRDMTRVRAMVASGHEFIASLRESEPAIWRAFQPAGGQSEVTMLWREGDTLCRLRADRIARDHGIVVDLKFSGVSAEPDGWGRTQMVRMGYYMRAAFYRAGVKALTGVEPDYVFLIVENAPPYLCSLVGVDPQAFALGGEKVAYALQEWRKCVAADHWPAYPQRVCYPAIPPWEAARWLERRGVETDAQGIPYDVSKLFSKSEV